MKNETNHGMQRRSFIQRGKVAAIPAIAGVIFVGVLYLISPGEKLSGNIAVPRSTDSLHNSRSRANSLARPDQKSDNSNKIISELKSKQSPLLIDISNFGKGEFYAIWEELNKFSGGAYDDLKMEAIIKAAHLENSTELIAFMTSSVGEGTEKNYYLNLVFSYSKENPEVLLKDLNSLKTNSSYKDCISGFTRNISRLASLNAIHDLLTNADADARKAILDGCALFYNATTPWAIGGRDERVGETLSTLNDIIGKGIFSDSEINDALTKMANEEPLLLWSEITQINGYSNFEKYDLLNKVFRKAYINNSIEALKLLNKQNFEKISPDLIRQVVASSLKFNAATGQKIIDSLYDEKMPQSVKNNFVAGEAFYYANAANMETAWLKVNQISDPAIKKQAEGQVWGRERDLVRNTVNAGPQKAIEELVSGKSQHDDYWIEEAMDVWMHKDFDNAEKWYQDNWKNLPADKAQYAAASFAKQAIKTGDLDVAEQWLTYINDPKTKERIQAEVSKAAGE
jgi:hypothetical protein